MRSIDRVSGVAFYPIKGASAATVNGHVPQSLSVGRTGFEVSGVRDRDFVLFDPAENAFVSQRGWGGMRDGKQSKRVRYPGDRQLATVQLDVRGDHVAVSSSAGQFEMSTATTGGSSATIDIFGKQFPVIDQGPDAARYFSGLLGREVQLMRADRERPRTLPDRYQRDGAFNQVAGADGMPFLLTSEASLAAAREANDMDPDAVPITRYRGNIIINGDGLGPFGEDYIDGDVRFGVGGIGMWAVKACSRCPVPDIDQVSGEVAGGGLRVLRGRAGSIFTGETGVFFGQNLVHDGVGVISVGNAVTVDVMSITPNVNFR